MTTFTGGFLGSGSGYDPLYPAVPPSGVEPFEELPNDLSLVGDEYSALALSGVVGSLAAPDVPVTYNGLKGTSCQRYYFYDVIHVEPVAFGLGSIASDTVLSVLLWNGYLGESAVTSVGASDDPGIISRFPEYPSGPTFYIAPLQEFIWEFLVKKDVGPASFNSNQSIYIDGADLVNRAYFVSIIGSRSQMWAFTHNWQTVCTETLEAKTAVNVSHNGQEHRTALREIARRTIDTELYLTRESARKLDHITFRKQASYFSAPIIPFVTRLTQQANSGDNFIYCDTAGRGFTVKSSAMLLDDIDSSGVSVGIEDVQANGLLLSSQLPYGWPRGSSVYPAGSARIIGDIPLTWQTKDFATGRLRMEFQPAFTPAFTPRDGDTDDYGSYYGSYDPDIGNVGAIEVLRHEPDWAGGLSKSFSQESGLVDTQVGATAVYDTWERPARVITHNWLLRNFIEVESFRRFWFRRWGRAVPFWAPSWTSDFRSVVRLYTAEDTEFVFKDSGFMSYSLQSDYSDDTKNERNHVQFQLKNGSVFWARITGAEAVDSEYTKIILDRGYPWTFESRDILRVSWLSLCRLADDAVTFEWLTPGVARVSLPIVTVPDYLYDYGFGGGGLD